METDPASTPNLGEKRRGALNVKAALLLLSVLVVATSGLVYELLIGTLASYVLGDSVTQFSTTIGTYLFAMGIGSYLSKFVDRSVAARFVEIELAAAIAGGFAAPTLFIAYAYSTHFSLVLYGLLILIGTLVGLEIPLLMRILREELRFEELVAQVLTVDYIGALIGSLLFAMVLVPHFGLNRTSMAFGLLNCAVAMMSTWALRHLLTRKQRIHLRIRGLLVAACLSAGLWNAHHLTAFAEQSIYADPIVFAKQTPFQRIVLTQNPRSVQLFLNGNLQFSSRDEYRYHEALVHPAFSVAESPERVLILGGGDGLALREVLRYPSVRSVVLVELDPEVVAMAKNVSTLRALNRDSLLDPRVELVHDDAMVWLDQEHLRPFDVLIIDFPDPNNFSLGKLYTSRFYALVRHTMHAESVLAVQSTSPYFARRSYWCIVNTIEQAGLYTAPYHAVVPSFGDWGFVLAKRHPFDTPQAPKIEGLKFLNETTMPLLFVFEPDAGSIDVEVNRLNTQKLVRYYAHDWAQWN
ncbi:MAG: polyamine aminopropyltransferase [Myxococcota bacterium]